MNRLFLLSILVLTIAINSCDSGKQLGQSKQTAQTYYSTGEFDKALSSWETIITAYESKGKEKDCDVYTNAAMASNKLGNSEKALTYLKKATYSDFSNEDTYFTLAEIYKAQDNLSLELENLEIYSSKYPQGKYTAEVNTRLFNLYTEIENWGKANEFWNILTPEQQMLSPQLESYLTVNDKLDNTDKCIELSNKLLAIDNNNLSALRWMTSHYFWKAEKRYQKEMKAYEANKTRKQYKHLLNVIDEVTVEYNKALNYGKKLYIIEPSPANAKILGNTYSRLNYKDKAKYYQKLGEE